MVIDAKLRLIGGFPAALVTESAAPPVAASTEPAAEATVIAPGLLAAASASPAAVVTDSEAKLTAPPLPDRLTPAPLAVFETVVVPRETKAAEFSTRRPAPTGLATETVPADSVPATPWR